MSYSVVPTATPEHSRSVFIAFSQRWAAIPPKVVRMRSVAEQTNVMKWFGFLADEETGAAKV